MAPLFSPSFSSISGIIRSNFRMVINSNNINIGVGSAQSVHGNVELYILCSLYDMVSYHTINISNVNASVRRLTLIVRVDYHSIVARNNYLYLAVKL